MTRSVPDPAAGAAHTTVLRARAIAEGVLDELRGPLLARSGRIDTRRKDDGTPVTASDLEVDRALARAIEREFSDHAILSEERDTTYGGSTWTWVIDPIDGTSNFAAGLPYWCVSVALLHEGMPALAVVDAPPLATRYVAVAGEGATRDGEPIRVMAPIDVTDRRNRHVPLLLTTGTLRRLERREIALNPRVLGSAALDLCVVAEGTAAGALQLTPHLWDMAAGGLLIDEAGGAVVALDEPWLPARPGTDYGPVRRGIACGPDEDWVRRLAAALRRDPIR